MTDAQTIGPNSRPQPNAAPQPLTAGEQSSLAGMLPITSKGILAATLALLTDAGDRLKEDRGNPDIKSEIRVLDARIALESEGPQ